MMSKLCNSSKNKVTLGLASLGEGQSQIEELKPLILLGISGIMSSDFFE